MSYELTDVEERHTRSSSFGIPSRQDRWTVPVGHFVKLVFKGEGLRGERMWVEVESRNEDGSYSGALRNRPAVISELKHGDSVRFEPRHIADVLAP
jgi:hypothetical protein